MGKVAIVACSNGQSREYENQNIELVGFLEKQGLEVLLSDCIYEKDGVFPGTVSERASQLMRMLTDPEVDEIYDISGGDIANQILGHLDYEMIRRSNAVFWGYSDLTTVLNAIYTKTGKPGVLYQIKNMVHGDFQKEQRKRFCDRKTLFDPHFEFVRGSHMKGIVVGGNIRCFLKLAGTPYFPDLEGKVLLLEALGGDTQKISTYLAQLEQLGAFEKISGILLGTFTTLEKDKVDVFDLVRDYADDLPVARTEDIGHACSSKAIMIGQMISL